MWRIGIRTPGKFKTVSQLVKLLNEGMLSPVSYLKLNIIPLISYEEIQTNSPSFNGLTSHDTNNSPTLRSFLAPGNHNRTPIFIPVSILFDTSFIPVSFLFRQTGLRLVWNLYGIGFRLVVSWGSNSVQSNTVKFLLLILISPAMM